LLFLIPVDSDDVAHEYEVLLNELQMFNPELLDKQRVLAITKCDMADEQMMDELKEELPNVPYIMISSHTQMGLVQLKDMLWKVLNQSLTV
jgi:GTP-binding protein